MPKVFEGDVKNHLDELKMLAQTANVETLGEITQKVQKINPAFYIGKGKAQQVVEQAKILGANVIIFDDELSPAQIKNYNKLAKKIKVIDRSSLILDIFKNKFFWTFIILLLNILFVNFINTGCLIYPVKLTCFETFSWSIGLQEVEKMILHYENIQYVLYVLD